MTIHVANTDLLQARALAQVWEPPAPINYLGWAEENIVFSERESPFPGPYNSELFVYFSEILRALSPEDPCRVVTVKKSAQLGGTVLANVFCGGSLDMAPGDFLYVHPTENNAQRWSKMKLVPMIKGTPALKSVFPQKARDGADSVLYKERMDGRGSILISGANSEASLSMVSMPRQVQDDLSKWEMNSAGDPETQADSRSQAHEFAKLLKISTPLIEPGCRITRSHGEGTQEYYHVPCPHCGFKQKLEWENMLANLDEAHPELAHFTCIDCGAVIEEWHRNEILKDGEWIAENPGAAREHRSFYIWSAYSVLQSFERIARAWLKAKGDPAREQTFSNDTVGIAYTQDGDAPPWEEIRDRAASSTYRISEIPPRALLLTMGIDCQKDRVEWHLVGWGRDGYRAVIDYGVIPGHISEKAIYPKLDQLLKNKWRNSAGQLIGIDRAAIDGNAWTEEVWDYSKRIPVSRLIMVRGSPSEMVPLIAKVKKQRSSDGKRVLKYASRFYNFNASVLKMALYRKIKKDDPAEFGFVDFPAGLDDEYFMQLTAERRVGTKRHGYTVYRWQKDAGQANEALDTMNQAEAAALNLKVRDLVDEHWERLEAERMVEPDDPQLDLEATQVAEPKPEQKTKPKRRKKSRRGSYMNGLN